jgi:hypothetical protein
MIRKGASRHGGEIRARQRNNAAGSDLAYFHHVITPVIKGSGQREKAGSRVFLTVGLIIVNLICFSAVALGLLLSL